MLNWLNEILEHPDKLTWENWTAIGVLVGIFCLYCLRSKPYA
jgi:hypothetical protein